MFVQEAPISALNVAPSTKLNCCKERPVGVDLEMNGNRYNFFSSTHPAATAQRYNAPNLTQKSYFWSVNGVGFCNNWTSGSANLDILYYNSISGLWEDSEEDILNFEEKFNSKNEKNLHIYICRFLKNRSISRGLASRWLVTIIKNKESKINALQKLNN